MAFQESPQQREARENRNSFFGTPPMFGPKLPDAPSKIRESQRQIERREAKEKFFEPKVLKESSVKDTAKTAANQDPPQTKIMERTGGKTKNEAAGGTLVAKDCEGTELFRIPYLRGIEGEQELRAGCDDSSSGSIGS